MPAWLLNTDILVAEWSDSILRALWQGSLVFGLVWLITTIFPKILPVIRCWLWRIVYLKLLIGFLVVPFRLPYFHLFKEFPIPVARLLNTDPVSQLLSTIPVTSCLNPVNPHPYFRPQFWFCLWLLGMGWFGIRLILLWNQDRRLHKGFNSFTPDQRLETLYLQLCSALKIRKPPRIFVSDTMHSPVLQGFIHPRIILPLDIVSQYPPDEIRIMLAHELSHLKRRDLFWNWLPLIVRCLFFFNPLVWLSERQWRDCHEICCDHLALQFTQATAADYGRILLKTTIMQPRLNLAHGIQHVTASYTSQSKQALKKRLLALGHHQITNSKLILVSFLIVVFTGFIVIFPWKLSPPINIGVTHYRNITYDYSNVINSMSIYVEIPFQNIVIKQLDIHIGNQETKELSNSGAVSAGYSSNLSVTSPYKRKNPQEVKFLIRTNAGDFQGKYVADFGKGNYNYGMEEFFISF